LYWAPVQDARRWLTYPRDVVVLDGFWDDVVGANASNPSASNPSASNARRQQVDQVLEGKPQRDKPN
jgi:hypothetical protein